MCSRGSTSSYWPSRFRRRREQLAHRGGDLRTTEVAPLLFRKI
jgi:hypothetical protein